MSNKNPLKYLIMIMFIIYLIPETLHAKPDSHLIRGYIAINVSTTKDDQGKKNIYLPGVMVYLKNLLDNHDNDPVRTDLSGRFTLAVEKGKKGRYQVCWKAKNFVNGCAKPIYTKFDGNKHIGDINIFPHHKKIFINKHDIIPPKTTSTNASHKGRNIAIENLNTNKPELAVIELPDGLRLLPDFQLPPGFVFPTPNSRNFTTVYGSVRNNDGDIPRYLEPMSNINYFTQVALLDEKGTEIDKVAVNNFGNYVLPRVPTKQNVTLRLLSENYQLDQDIHTDANLKGASIHSINLELYNSAPKVEPLVVFNQSNKVAKHVKPGDELRISAKVSDKDGDTVKVRWMVLDGSGKMDDPLSKKVNWKIPKAEGVYRAQMIAYDGKGGYSRSTVRVQANVEGIVFSGKVIDNKKLPVDKAEIEINGQIIKTKIDGTFNTMVDAADRFVFNVRKKGYGLVSKIYSNTITGGTWVMVKSSTYNNLNPKEAIKVTDKRDYTQCPGPEFLSLNWKGYPGLDKPRIQDGKSNSIFIGTPGIKFESLPVKKSYKYKDTFTDGNMKMSVGKFIHSNGNSTKKGVVIVDNSNNAGGSGKDMMTNNATIKLAFKKPQKKLTLKFGEFGGNINLKINGKLLNVDSLQLLNGETVNNVLINVKMNANKRHGKLSLSGGVKSLAIGGQEFWVDEILKPIIPKIYVNRECGPGIKLSIPANSLVDSNGNPPAGKISIDLNTIDLMSPRQMPGDYTVEIGGNETGVMRSFGAGSIEIYDNNNEYNLKAGAKADLIIPVDQAQLVAGAQLPNIIPLLYYNETKGNWYQDGEAKLQGNKYISEVKHFSTINTDLIKTDQSCVRILSPTLPATYTLEVLIPDPNDPNASPILKSSNITNSPPFEHVIYNLPSNVNIVLIPIRDSDTTPFGQFVVNTGGQQNPTNPNLPVGPPYDACSTEVTLEDLVIPDQPTSGEFLHGLTTFAATNLDELDPADPTQNALLTSLQDATANYYTQIDPRKRRTTLSDFKSINSFDPATETRLSYANGGDLAFGRDMHCTKTNVDDNNNGIEEADEFDVACYVTNYGDITSDDATDAEDAQSAGLGGGSDPVATVAMEYSRIESTLDPNLDPNDPAQPDEFDDPQRVVKFYVYKGGDATDPLVAIDQDGNGDGVLDQLLQNAALDSPLSSGPGDADFRPRPIPQLCMVCHGGEYPGGAVPSGAPPFSSRDEVKLGSNFIPFDSTYYVFPSPPNDELNPNVQAALKSMNEDYVLITEPGAPIERIITNLYSGVDPNIQDELDTVVGWNGANIHRDMYQEVISDTCRMCHAPISFPDLDFDTSASFISKLGQAENRVCAQHVMPHAKATHDIFWSSTSPSMSAMFQIYGDTFGAGNGWAGTTCGEFTPGGDTPVTVYESTIQPIFNTHCTGCHTGASPPAGLNLSAGISYSNIVGVASTQLASMTRISANDPDNSYLYLKINDTHTGVGVGGSGDHMPPSYVSQPLINIDATAVTEIFDWINDGAQN